MPTLLLVLNMHRYFPFRLQMCVLLHDLMALKCKSYLYELRSKCFRTVPLANERSVARSCTCSVTSPCQYWDMCYTCFCDYVHMYVINFTMDQRANIKFCIKREESAMETLEMLQKVFGDEAISWARCSEWQSRFKTSLEDDLWPLLMHMTHVLILTA